MLGDVRESIDIVTVTSAEALENLAGAASWTVPWLSRRTVVAVSERVAGVARALNLSRVVVAGAADPASIVEAAVRAVAEPDRNGADVGGGRNRGDDAVSHRGPG